MRVGVDAATPDGPPPRALPRAGGTISPLVWRLDDVPADAGPFMVAARAGGWFYLPATLTEEDVQRFADFRGGCVATTTNYQLPTTHCPGTILGVHVEALLARDPTPLHQKLAVAAGGKACDAVMLEDADPLDLKAGRPYQRLTRLRDGGLARLIFLSAPDVAAAEWLVENTAAHAVAVPFGLADPTAGHRLLGVAKEIGTAILARRPDQSVWTPPGPWAAETDVSFRLADPAVAAAVEPLPGGVEQTARLLRAAADPMPPAEREQWWAAFARQVPPPPKSRTGHPPEYGA